MTPFRHEALLYAGETEFVDATTTFIRDALAEDEPILVVVNARKIDALRDALAGDADGVEFADMAEVGANPARIIPAWRDFVDRYAGGERRLRGIGEPISAARSAAELVECQRHESLLNLAFADSSAWWLLCPYDTEALDAAVIDEARRSHPFIDADGVRSESGVCRDLASIAAPFDRPLPEPAMVPYELSFDAASLVAVRRFVAGHAAAAGLDPVRSADLALAAHEVASNSVRHADGRGTVRAWQDGETVVCEVRDAGWIERPLAGRELPSVHQAQGRGLWMANQFCDLVQVRSSGAGTVVRLHLRRS
jgi:anti-sigma regulatory factor (Ser/Thr protein kinase)